MIFKCKICGGNLEIEKNSTIATCEYCGTKQTLPKLENDKVTNLYDRANHFRQNNEYDKAENLYNMILNEDSKDAEAYWSLVLCEYGITYVKDPKTDEYIPTCNRTQKISIFSNENYKQALKYANEEQEKLYKAEAEKINNIQKGILEIANKESNFDVFICYKETDENGQRTQDSVIAQELYYQLQKEGFKVFFSKITLENKIGESYEPYIYAALNSAKVMIVIGTQKEYFEAPWVKNEWSRYLTLIKNGENKTIIPCFKNMDAYDLPEEFAYLQSQDMSKLGFEQDLVYGVKKIVNSKPKAKKNEKTPFIIAAIVAFLVITIAIIIAFTAGKNTSTKEEQKKVLKQDITAVSGYTFNITVSELKDKIMESINNSDYKDYGIEAKIIDAYDGYDGQTCLGIGWITKTSEYEPESVIGIEIYNESGYIEEDDYVSMIACAPAKYGSGEMSQLIMPVNLYKEAKKILGGETAEWKRLEDSNIIKERTYNVFTGEEIYNNDFFAGDKKELYINGK